MTFTFTMDAFPGFTYFDQTKKVLCVIQVIEDAEGAEEVQHTVMGHKDNEEIDTAFNDSTAEKLTVTLTRTPALAATTAEIDSETGKATVSLGTTPTFSVDVLEYTLSGNEAESAGSKEAVVTYSVDDTKLAAYNAEYGRSFTAADVVVPTATTLAWTATTG